MADLRTTNDPPLSRAEADLVRAYERLRAAPYDREKRSLTIQMEKLVRGRGRVVLDGVAYSWDAPMQELYRGRLVSPAQLHSSLGLKC